MGKRLARIAQASNIAKTLAFDIKPAIVIGLAMHWSWIWLGFWSSIYYSVEPDFDGMAESIALVEPLWVLSLLANALGLAALFALRRRIAPLGKRPWAAAAAALLTAAGTVVTAQIIPLPANDLGQAAYAAAALLTGLGSALSFALWGELLTVQGMRQTVVYSVSATLAGSLLYFAGLMVDAAAMRAIVSLFPLASMGLYWTQRDFVVANHGKREEADSAARERGQLRKHLVALVALSLFFGSSYGFMKGLFSLSGDELMAWRDTLNIAAFIVGAMAIFVTASTFKMDFKHLTYQVALPLMAVGFLFMPLLDAFQLAGFFLHQLGYQYFYVVLWALWPALAKNNEHAPAITFCCASMTGMQAGQLVGSLAGASLIQYASDPYTLAMMAAVAIFIILMVALFGFGNTISRSRWWGTRPMGGATPTKFRHTCEHVAATHGLSARETEVFLLLAKGRNCGYISKQLVVSEPTTKTHIKNVYRKLGVHSQQALLDLVEFENK